MIFIGHICGILSERLMHEDRIHGRSFCRIDIGDKNHIHKGSKTVNDAVGDREREDSQEAVHMLHARLLPVPSAPLLPLLLKIRKKNNRNNNENGGNKLRS